MGTQGRRTARIVGVLFITAMVAGMIRYVLLDPILDAPDYLINVSTNENQVIIGALSFFFWLLHLLVLQL